MIVGIQSGFTIFAEDLDNESAKTFSLSEINTAHTADKEEYKKKEQTGMAHKEPQTKRI